jgi:hypothetical protein
MEERRKKEFHENKGEERERENIQFGIDSNHTLYILISRE